MATHKNITLPLIILFACIAGVAGSDVYLSRLAHENSTILGTVRSGEQRDEHFQKLSNTWDAIAPRVGSVQSLLPDDTTFPIFVEYLESSAHQNNVGLQIDFDTTSSQGLAQKGSTGDTQNTQSTSKSQQKTPTDTLPTITFKLTATGPSTAVVSFYKTLEQSPYFLRIDSATFNGADSFDTLVTLTAILTLYVDTSLAQ